MTVVAVGDFDPKMMELKIKKQFSSIPVKTNKRPLQSFNVPDNKEIIIKNYLQIFQSHYHHLK